MTVWTKVTLEEVNDWLDGRGLVRTAEIIPIEEGSEDSLYRLNHEDGSSSCLRLIERTEPDGPSEMAERLAAFGLPSCPPVRDGKKRFQTALTGKPAVLYPWIEGTWVPRPSPEQIESIGDFLGRMGRIGLEHGSGWVRENPRGWGWVEETVKKLSAVLDSAQKKEVEAEAAAQLAYWPTRMSALPQGPIHADLFRDNALFDAEGKLAAVIDWGFCASPWPLVFDLAIVANEWCLENSSFEFDQIRLASLMQGRCRELPMTEAERDVWPMALRWGALRFYLSRLHEFYFPRAEGKRLDPDRYRGILQARQKI